MTTGMMQDQNLEKHIEKQMGCMAGFLQIFDRHQILSRKHLHSPKRLLPPSSGVIATPESGTSAATSPAISREFGLPKPANLMTKLNPEHPRMFPQEEMRSPEPELPPRSPLPLPILQLKEGAKSSWKFSKEVSRLSLDSRATTDAKGSLHPKEIRTSAAYSCGSTDNGMASDGQLNRSPSVIARLMGLEPIQDSSNTEPERKQPELRRSASESRVSRDVFHPRFVMDANNFHSKHPIQSHSKDTGASEVSHYADPLKFASKKVEETKGLNTGGVHPFTWKAPLHRKNFFDSGDIFPEPKQTISVYGELEKRLKIRGIDEPSKDLETLKQILEAVQLKGLLHAKKPSERSHLSYQNFVYDHSPVAIMKPSRSPMTSPADRRTGNGSSPSNDRNPVRGIRQNLDLPGEKLTSVSPRRERNVRSPTRQARSSSPPSRQGKSSNSLVKPKPLSVETQSRVHELTPNQRVSHIHSPKANTRKTGSRPRSPVNKKSAAEIHQKEKTTAIATEDESSTISESTASTSSHTDTESKIADHKDGRNLLERCDKLLNSIAEITSTDSQPSPVSVLDSFESPSPSLITMKRRIDFKADQSGEREEEILSPVISPIQSKCEEISEDSDFVYICDILNAFRYVQEDSSIFLLLEKKQCLKGKDTSNVSRLERKLIYDTVNEILDWNRKLPPWKSISWTLGTIWAEFRRIRERDAAEDMFETICGILMKDMAADAINGWGDCPVEMSESVLDIERLIYKDLIGETIQDLTLFASKSKLNGMHRRRLVF